MNIRMRVWDLCWPTHAKLFEERYKISVPKNGLEEIKAANAMLDDIEKAMLVMNEDGSLEEF